MATVFWDRMGILLTDFMASGTTITSEIYCETLNKLRRSIQNKRRGMLTKGVVLLHDNTRPHTAARTGRFSTTLLTVRTWLQAIIISSPRWMSGWLPSASTPTKSSWMESTTGCIQGRIKLFGASRQWKHFRPLFQAVFLSGGGITPQTESNTTPPNPKTEISNILFYVLNLWRRTYCSGLRGCDTREEEIVIWPCWCFHGRYYFYSYVYKLKKTKCKYLFN